MKKKVIHSIGPLLGLLLFLAALWILRNELKEYHYQEVVRDLKSLPISHLLLGFGLTMLSYLIMTGYDALALHYVRYPLPYRKIALASFIGYAFSNNVGLSMIAGGTVRYRLYSAWGLSTEEITKVVAFCTLTIWLGFAAFGGVIFLLQPMVIPRALRLPFGSVQPFGVLLIFLSGGYFLLSALRKTPLKIREWEFPLPSVQLSLFQAFVASLDWAVAGSVFYGLLPTSTNLSYTGFISIFLLAQMMGLVSQIPGGLGVFEAMILTLLAPNFPIHSLLGSLLAYRAIYYLLPLCIAAVSLGVHEVLLRKVEIKKTALVVGRWIPVLLPNVFAFAIFVAGAILLFSRVTPAMSGQLTWLSPFLSLPVIEISHFLGSLVGVGLLFLARGLQRRLDGAYLLTLALLAAGIIFSLLKGFEFKMALVLAVMFGALLPSRHHFYRKASLIGQRFTSGWMIAIIVVLLCSAWLGIFSYKNITYSDELWWQFALYGDAPRFLRATAGTIAVAMFFALASLLRSTLPEPALPGKEDLEKAHEIVTKSRKTYANLALLGDKALFFSENKTVFIMYGIEGQSRVVLGDPVGPEGEMTELVWQFHEMCDRYDGWTVFYEIQQQNADIYLDLGLTLYKLGEEARISLKDFSLEGSDHRGLRRTHHKVEGKGCIFKIIPSTEISSHLPELKVISDTWLKEKNTKEKKFSLGFLKEEYLKQFPAGIVEKDGKILAFTNIFLGAEKEELSADLMRFLPEAPNGVMDYLFIELMLWGKREGYKWFNLGMAPLSGLENDVLAPIWNRLGTFIFRHGEHFYNFQGVREYKEKFDPKWEARYLASPGGLALPRILINIASLISGGLKGVVAK